MEIKAYNGDCKGTKWLAIVLAVALSLVATQPSEGVRQGTVANVYNNAPDWRQFTDFERVVLSPRANTARGGWALDSLRARGVKVYFWTQPNVSTWQGKPIMDWPSDAAVWSTALAYNAVHKDSSGAYVPIYLGPGWYSLDFSVPGFPEALADAYGPFLSAGDGILHDHGCSSSSWMRELYAIPGVDWAAWAEGYRIYRQRLSVETMGIPQIAECDAWSGYLPSVSAGVLLENVGHPRYQVSYTRAWDLLQAKPLSVLLCQSPIAQVRRCLATMALVSGCGFNYNPAFFSGGGYTNARDFEHFELDIGTPGTSIIKLSDQGVYLRPFSRGWALLNISSATYKYQNYSVSPNDGLVVQTRDANGRYIVKRTNIGR